MDPVTHTLLGATTGYALFHRRLGRRAAVVGALAGAIPDIDVFSRSSTDALVAIELHRNFTHSIPFAVIGSLLVALLWIRKESLRAQWVPLWACAFAAYLSHCLLDASTSYGTVLFWPFTRERFGWDWISILDLLFTGALAVGLWFALRRQQARIAYAALAWCALYLSFGALQHARAKSVQQTLATSRGHVIERAEAMPTLLNNVVWRSLYQCNGRLYADRIRVGWFGGITWSEGTSLPRVTARELTPAEAARNQEGRAFERFAWFSEDWVARSPQDETVLGDMRYSLSNKAFDPVWGIRFNPAGPAVSWVSRSRDRRVDAKAMLAEIFGSHPDYKPLQKH